MRKIFCGLALAVLTPISLPLAFGTQADTTTVTIGMKTAGVTPFISQVSLTINQPSVLKSIRFTIKPKTGSVTRPLSANYSSAYLISRGFFQVGSDEIFLPVYGLYAGVTNSVTFTYQFQDGSSKQATTDIATETFHDPCGYDHPTVLQARTKSKSLSYDFIMAKRACSGISPVILDSDGALRWAGPDGFPVSQSTFFDNAIYIAKETSLYRIDLDGTVTLLHDYANIGIISFHHNIDRGKVGIILDANTSAHQESLNLEVDIAGNVIKKWDMVDIISKAMIAGGDNPSHFIVPSSNDWFHNNSVTYNRVDDSLVISSRENFVICLDYKTLAIKWILGDETKEWFQYPSLAKYALSVPAGGVPPIGQHAVSITHDLDLMVFDNGKDSDIHTPRGLMRAYASPRKYRLDLAARTATEVWSFEMNQSVPSSICSSVYEDAPFNYLIDYADVNGPGGPVQFARFLGLDAAGTKIFYYQYPTHFCTTAFNAIPIHLEDTAFPTVGPQALNVSTRAFVGQNEKSLIGGLIITGQPKTVVLRALGPSLSAKGVSGALADPVLGVYDSSGKPFVTNDNWQHDPHASDIAAVGLAPKNAAEAATYLTLSPAAYTIVVTGKNATQGIGLVEAYDLSPTHGSRIANLSTRGFIGQGDGVLISGFIIGDVASASVIVRALGPSLSSAGVTSPLSNPHLAIFDENGGQIAENDNWRDDPSASAIAKNGLAPTDSMESATALNLAAGSYTAIVSGVGTTTGVGLVEVYHLE